MIYAVPELGLQEDAALAQIDELRRELRYYVSEPRRWVGYVRRVLAARAIQGSNSIEGYNVSVEDAAFRRRHRSPEKKLRTADTRA